MHRTVLIQAVAALSLFTVSTLAAQAGEGRGVYKKTCMYCHQSGVLGAPPFGDNTAWQPRIAQGREVLYRHALRGYKGMPAKGANPTLTDAQVRLAVDYMVRNASNQPSPQPSAQRMRVQSSR